MVVLHRGNSREVVHPDVDHERLLPLHLRILAPPIRFAGFRIDMVWHGRTTDEPAQRWFRNVVAETAAKL